MKTILINTLLASGIAACETKGSEPQEVKAFMLSDTMMSRITLDEVRTEAVRNELTLVGKIIPDENRVIKVFPLVGGNVEDVNAELGDYVRKGQVLVTIRSGEVADFERQMIKDTPGSDDRHDGRHRPVASGSIYGYWLRNGDATGNGCDRGTYHRYRPDVTDLPHYISLI